MITESRLKMNGIHWFLLYLDDLDVKRGNDSTSSKHRSREPAERGTVSTGRGGVILAKRGSTSPLAGRASVERRYKYRRC